MGGARARRQVASSACARRRSLRHRIGPVAPPSPCSLSCGGFCIVCTQQPCACGIKTRYVCVLIRFMEVECESQNTFPQVTASREMRLAVRLALKHKRIAFSRPGLLRARVAGPACPVPGACNTLASAAFLACFASVEALLTRAFPRFLHLVNLPCKPCKRIDRHLQDKNARRRM